MIKHFVAAVLVGGTLIAVASQRAHAADDYPGLMCERWRGAAEVVGDYGSADNPSGSGNLLLVECPIVKNISLGTTVRYAIPYVSDMNPSDNVRCSLWSARRGTNGFVSHSTPHQYSSGASGNAMALTSGPLGPPPGGHAGSTVWFVYCELPPATSILKYTIVE